MMDLVQFNLQFFSFSTICCSITDICVDTTNFFSENNSNIRIYKTTSSYNYAVTGLKEQNCTVKPLNIVLIIIVRMNLLTRFPVQNMTKLTEPRFLPNRGDIFGERSSR